MTEPLFDPNSVRRYAPIEYDEMPGEMVLFEDYSKLLSLYRELLSTCESAQQLRP